MGVLKARAAVAAYLAWDAAGQPVEREWNLDLLDTVIDAGAVRFG